MTNTRTTIPRPRGERAVKRQRYFPLGERVSLAQIYTQLQEMPQSTVGIAQEVDRLRAQKHEAGVGIFADFALVGKTLTIDVEAGSLCDGYRRLIMVVATLALWITSLWAFLSFTGGSQSLTDEWARRHGGGDSPLVSEMVKSGQRPTPDGIRQTHKPMGTFDLILDDPSLLSTIFAPIAIIGAIATGAVRLTPCRVWDKLGTYLGVPTEVELHEAADRFLQQILEQLRPLSRAAAAAEKISK